MVVMTVGLKFAFEAKQINFDPDNNISSHRLLMKFVASVLMGIAL